MSEQKYPYTRDGITFVGRVKAGSRIISYGGQPIVIHPDEEPMAITAAGLVPIEMEEEGNIDIDIRWPE